MKFNRLLWPFLVLYLNTAVGTSQWWEKQYTQKKAPTLKIANMKLKLVEKIQTGKDFWKFLVIVSYLRDTFVIFRVSECFVNFANFWRSFGEILDFLGSFREYAQVLRPEFKNICLVQEYQPRQCLIQNYWTKASRHS